VRPSGDIWDKRVGLGVYRNVEAVFHLIHLSMMFFLLLYASSSGLFVCAASSVPSPWFEEDCCCNGDEQKMDLRCWLMQR
jgi:hypothetical protein